MTSRLLHYEAKCVQCKCFQWGSVPLRSNIKRTPASILIPHERQLIALRLCRRQFLYNETLQHTSRPLLPKLVDDKFRYFIPILRKLGDVEPWLMARWKARIRLPDVIFV